MPRRLIVPGIAIAIGLMVGSGFMVGAQKWFAYESPEAVVVENLVFREVKGHPDLHWMDVTISAPKSVACPIRQSFHDLYRDPAGQSEPVVELHEERLRD